MKFFNTVGAIDPNRHYFLSHRLDWKQLSEFIERQYYFILHAPRQSGKTTAIIEFVKHLNQEGMYTALYLSTESAHATTNDIAKTMKAILSELRRRIHIDLHNKTDAASYLEQLLARENVAEDSLINFLTFWAEHNPKPLVIFFDEFDGLMGESLISILKQLRQGYTNRPKYFPQTVCLIGVRDLRDYKIKTKLQEELGVLYSPFNIKAESIVLPNFSQEDVKTLYLQHTTETGQNFTDDALEYAFVQTQGQPWLVNALAYQACFRDVQDRSQTITKEILERAKDALILRRDTHIDALTDRLKEPRVCTIIDAILSGRDTPEEFAIDDISYLIDLGLIVKREQRLEIANPIYKEIIPRELSYGTQLSLTQSSTWYVRPDGTLDTSKLLDAFQQFYRENSDVWLERFAYKEAGPHILLMAFLQRVINGGGNINREYALGSKRVDLLVLWKSQRIVMELKIWKGEKAYLEGLEQTTNYMNTCNATEGHLVIFDRSKTKGWDEKIYRRQELVKGKTIEVWGM